MALRKARTIDGRLGGAPSPSQLRGQQEGPVPSGERIRHSRAAKNRGDDACPRGAPTDCIALASRLAYWRAKLGTFGSSVQGVFGHAGVQNSADGRVLRIAARLQIAVRRPLDPSRL